MNYLNVILLPQVKVYYSPYNQPAVIKQLPVSINNRYWSQIDYKDALKTRTKEQRTPSIKTKELLTKNNENNEN